MYKYFRGPKKLMAMFQVACAPEDYRTQILVIALAERNPEFRFYVDARNLSVVADKQESFSVLAFFKEKFACLHY
ncbi:MAG: hypothetical protein OXC30_05615 [Alphaproteobacteria bacterium]|nr:hypothetical protein [Alphaproteobacteria bacterium]